VITHYRATLFTYSAHPASIPSGVRVEVLAAGTPPETWDFANFYPVRILAGAKDTVKARFGAPLSWTGGPVMARQFKALVVCLLLSGASKDDVKNFFVTLGTAMTAFQQSLDNNNQPPVSDTIHQGGKGGPG
jgi:hypothetical protein